MAMGGYRLAICEDDPRMRAQLRTLCGEILTGMGVACQIAAFPSADALDEVLRTRSEPFHLLLLDIQMEGMSGMELARALREREDEVGVIFISASTDYLLEGYEVRPIHYLLKPVGREALEKAIRTHWRQTLAPRTVALRAGGKSTSLPVEEIRYVESRDHGSLVCLTGGDQFFRLPLAQVERLLPAGQFARCHNSFLVNLAHVKLVGRGALTLRDGASVPVGRRYYDPFQNAFVTYINR